ncbi:MAG TPA: ATP-binding protein, partial [bacterium]|nr:ATP-binding protein [bacterium]
PDQLFTGVWAVIVAAAVYNLILHLLSRDESLAGPLTFFGFFLDGLLASWGIAISGGPVSVYIPFYLCIIMAACLMLSPRQAAVTALAQLGMFLATLWFCYEYHIPSEFAPRNSNLFFVYLESAATDVRRDIYVEQAIRWSFYFLLTAGLCGSLVRQVWNREERLRGKERDLEQKRHLIQMGELTGRIAHGVNTPLGLISGNLEMLMAETRKKSQAYKRLAQIEQYVQRAIHTVRDILNYSRHTLSEIQPTSLLQVIKAVTAAVQPKLRRVGGKLILDVGSQLPLITAYPEGLFQALLNLVENAVDSIAAGGLITLSAHFHYRSMRLSAEDKRGHIKVVIRDTGKGISPAELKRIFEPFYSTKGFGKGTGLGLAIVKRIVEEHHGDIKVESRVGEGTMFTLLLPVGGLKGEESANLDGFYYNKNNTSLKGPEK